MKHKHAEVIKAWADGAIVEEYRPNLNQWVEPQPYPIWDARFSYRIKPEPKPDVVAFAKVYNYDNFIAYIGLAHPEQDERDNFKLTFDGETGALKNAEVIK
jgi:hypothetical protein